MSMDCLRSMCCMKKQKRGRGKNAKAQAKQRNLDQESRQNELRNLMFHNFSMQGEGPKKVDCQDSFTIIDNNPHIFHFFAVFDGHGSSGKEASNAACDNFQQFFEKRLEEIKRLKEDKKRDIFLKKTFKFCETKLKVSGIDYSNSGSCCIAIFLQGNGCTIANLGDSRAVLFRRTPKDMLAIELSHDHKPTRKDEKERILRKGGKVERLKNNGEFVGPYRVWADEEGPGIAMSRTLGDLQGKKIGLISEPELSHIELKPGDKFIVIASDGVWDVMNSAEVVGFILQADENENPAEALVKEARGRWVALNKAKKVNNKIGDYPSARRGIDDITVVIGVLSFAIDEEPELYG
jgi:integrin-linked kinase-associated serine/threonine phosphatase 2C